MTAADECRMRMTSGRFTIYCAALLLVLTSVSAVQRLNSIEDLKRIDFGRTVPTHSLVLLYWFANTVVIDSNNAVRLTFDLESEEYGSHHYGNFERLLDQVPPGYQYYTIGNLYQDTSEQFPDYVVNAPGEDMGGNRDRIIIRVQTHWTRGRASHQIDQVFITQHYETSDHQGTVYDPDHTYQITTNLLRQIREFSGGHNQQQLQRLRNRFGSNINESQLWYITNTWGNLACLGLFLFIVRQQTFSFIQLQSAPVNRQNDNDSLFFSLLIVAVIIFIIAVTSFLKDK